MSSVLYNDIELLEGLAAGDKAVVTAIYRTYHPVLMKWMLSRGGLEADAEDIFQEALVVLYEKAQQAEFCLTCKLSTYLFAVSKRLWYKKLNDNGTKVSLSDTDKEEELNYGSTQYDEDLEEHREKEEQFLQLEQSLKELGTPCAELIKAFYIDKKSMLEIASTFNYTNAENAKTQKYKCLNRLKKIFFAKTSEIEQ